MRIRRTAEEIFSEPSPVMYTQSQLHLVDGLRSSFPNWRGSHYFDYRNGWTRMGDFYAEGYFLREQMKELVHNRYGVTIECQQIISQMPKQKTVSESGVTAKRNAKVMNL